MKMHIKNDHEQHPLVFAEGILGLLGYSPDGLWTTVADGGNHFLLHGITENSLLVVDRKLPYEEGKLNVFQTDKVRGGVWERKLSLTKLEGFPYMGCVILTINRYE